jgi:hypothetical protein
MRREINTCAAVLLSFLVAFWAAPAGAQWLDHPTPGLARTADGKPKLDAPTPRAADGKPDLSGVWSVGGLGYATNITNTEMLPWAQKVFRQRLETYGSDDPAVGCLPEGPRAGIAGLDPLRIVQTPNLTLIVHETGTTRHVFTDGRPMPKDPTPSWMGYSVGRWEGDTFVVETTGYNDRTWLDFSGHPHSDALKVTERYRRADVGHMQLAMTFDDPKTYTKPFTITMAVSLMPDTDLIENVCLENEKDRTRLVGKVSDERRQETKVSSAVLARYAGTYVMGPLGEWQVSVAGNDLQIELGDGGGKQTVFPQSDTLFVFPSTGGTVRFVTDDQGVATHLVLTIVEGDMQGERKK